MGSTGKKKRGMGRPRIQINIDQLNELCRIQCTLPEIAGVLLCSEDTVERFIDREFGVTFAEYFKSKSADGRVSLRRRQFEAALNEEKANVPLLIFLGKNYLGQSDAPDPGDSKDPTFNPLPSMVDDREPKPT